MILKAAWIVLVMQMVHAYRFAPGYMEENRFGMDNSFDHAFDQPTMEDKRRPDRIRLSARDITRSPYHIYDNRENRRNRAAILDEDLQHDIKDYREQEFVPTRRARRSDRFMEDTPNQFYSPLRQEQDDRLRDEDRVSAPPRSRRQPTYRLKEEENQEERLDPDQQKTGIKGLGAGVWATYKQTAQGFKHTLQHPVETGKRLVEALSDPKSTLETLMNSEGNSCKGSRSYCWGRRVGSASLLLSTGGVVSTLAMAGKAGAAAGAAVQVAGATNAAGSAAQALHRAEQANRIVHRSY